jgi:hypothetical protein
MRTQKVLAGSALRLSLVALAVGLTTGFDSAPALAQNATQTRPITAFVDAQGTFCFPDGMGGCLTFVPPVANFIGWTDRARNRALSVDYAGLVDDFFGGALGTTTAGTVTERPLADGRAEVTVVLHTRKGRRSPG